MKKRLFNLVSGITVSSMGIACVLNSGLGCFSLTAANTALTNWFGISLSMAGMIMEGLMLLYATYKGEGIGLTAIVNATFGSIAMDLFHLILPKSPWMILGLVLLPLGNSIMGSAAFGDSGSNILMNALMKSTGKSISLIRTCIEFVFLVIGFLGARENVTLFTFILTFGFGPLLQLVYKFVGYQPITVEHDFIIKKS